MLASNRRPLSAKQPQSEVDRKSASQLEIERAFAKKYPQDGQNTNEHTQPPPTALLRNGIFFIGKKDDPNGIAERIDGRTMGPKKRNDGYIMPVSRKNIAQNADSPFDSARRCDISDNECNFHNLTIFAGERHIGFSSSNTLRDLFR
jgi:hypothetical protein